MADVNCQPICSICHQIHIKPAALPCGHTFCVSCLALWLRQRRVCPHCSRKVPVRFQPIGLCGWDDVLESLALQLPEEEQQERQLAKRQREEEDEKLKPAKRTRTGRNWNNTPYSVLNMEEGYGSYQNSDEHLSHPVGFFDDLEAQSEAADDWEEDWISGEDEDEAVDEGGLDEEEVLEEEAVGEEGVEEDEEEDSLAEEAEDESSDYFVDVSNNAVEATIPEVSNPTANMTVGMQYMHPSDILLNPNVRNMFQSVIRDGQHLVQTLIDQEGNYESEDEDDEDEYAW